jgi:hypothetical protein
MHARVRHVPVRQVHRLKTSAYVSIRQHTSAYGSIRQNTSAYVSIRQHTSAYVRHVPVGEVDRLKDCLGLAVLEPLLRHLPEKARQRFLSVGRRGANEVHLKVLRY